VDTAETPAGMAEPAQVVVVGAGPGGLSASYALRRRGLTVRVLDGGDRVGSVWRGHYDGLRLNSGRIISSLPGMRMDRRYGRWVRRDDFIAYLERYAGRIDVPIEFGTVVRRLDRVAGGWQLHTTGGTMLAPAVVMATGLNAVPHLPSWADETAFHGLLVHATGYRNAAPYRGCGVLVVGSGPTAQDIALELANGGAAWVSLSVRTPPLLMPPSFLGMSSAILSYLVKHGPPAPPAIVEAMSLWLHRRYFPDAGQYLGTPPAGLVTALGDRGHGLAVEIGLLAALRQGRVAAVAAVDHFDGTDVVLCDGQRLQPDVVIAATGQRTGLEPVVGHLGVLGPDGRPLTHGAKTTSDAPDLHFIGYRLPAGQLVDMRADAPAIARRLRRRARTLSTSASRTGGRR
jgi:putative flavoprotein involved in K+ transport